MVEIKSHTIIGKTWYNIVVFRKRDRAVRRGKNKVYSKNKIDDKNKVSNKNKLNKRKLLQIGFIFIALFVVIILIHRQFLNNHWKSDGITSGIKYDLPTITESTDFSKISNKINLFTYEYFKNMNSKDKTENIFVSPYSLYQSMAMLSFGANGETKTQILESLYLTELEDKEIGENQYLLNKKLFDTKNAKVFSGNSLWLDNSLILNDKIIENFVAPIENYFHGDVFYKDLAKTSTMKEIDDWASKNTEGHISKISPELNTLDLLCLLNAVYFDSKWANAFQKSMTVEDSFYGIEKESQVSMMNITETKFKTFYTEELQGIRIPYKEDYVMEILMTNSEINQTIQDFCKNKSVEELREIFQLFDTKSEDINVNLQLPKFKMVYTDKDVISILRNLGINNAFTIGADFTEISKRLFIDKIFQKTYIEVDEEGTKAFAISFTGGKTSSPRKDVKEFIVNRPFIFTIREETTDTILFIGSIIDL